MVANGVLAGPGAFQGLISSADLVIAADGGARALLHAGLRPDIILGDFDSLEHDLLRRWRHDGGTVVTFPAEKDETDLELAVQYALKNGARRVAILGALGGRVDHELANLFLLAMPMLDGVDAQIVAPRTRALAIRDHRALAGRPGDLLSLLPLDARVDGIVTTGLKYALAGETLLMGPSRGVSNVFTEARVTVRVGSGVLLAIHTWPDDRTPEW